MVILLKSLAVRITRWDVGGRRYQKRIFLSALRCAATIEWKASAFLKLVVTSLRTPVIPE